MEYQENSLQRKISLEMGKVEQGFSIIYYQWPC